MSQSPFTYLKECGYRFKVRRFRRFKKHGKLVEMATRDDKQRHLNPQSCGGETRILLLGPNGLYAEGKAQCRSDELFINIEGAWGALYQALEALRVKTVAEGERIVIEKAQNLIAAASSNRAQDIELRARAVQLRHEGDYLRFAEARKAAAERKAAKMASAVNALAPGLQKVGKAVTKET